MQQILIIVVIFLAVFTQSLSGFGVALVAMALLPEVVSIQVATPLVALVAGTLEVILLLRYRHSLNVKAVWRIVLASILGIPLGVWALSRFDEKLVITLLGVVITGYALYGLLELKLPELNHPAWAYGLGFLAGALGGAYNTSGPPVIIYGNCRRWAPKEFKSNLQSFFLVNSLLVIAGHAWNQNFTTAVLNDYLVVLPVIGLGILAGVSLDKVINPAMFRKLVLWLLIFMGLRLIF